MVLTVLHPTVDAGSKVALNVDIIAVHGLNGDPISTWTKSDNCWLRDFLPQDVVGARILSFGYNADVAFGNTTADIIDHAKDLLGSLIDKREGDDELRRPIIFIAHSLGGIVVKQALFQARIEDRYHNINEHTVGIIFMGTPHRGSEKASYGKVLAKIATTVMNKPSSRLVPALKRNSDALMRLTSDFKFQLSNYQVVSFYEMKPMKLFSTLIVEKESALLEVDGEDQIPVDENHSNMCKFETRDNPTYEKLWIRVHRMIKAKNVGQPHPNLSSKLYNKHYDVPYNVSPIFTGREDVGRQLREGFFHSKLPSIPNRQMRFVLHGLGGSGKTQTSLKFTQDFRENYWGIFWIDASSNETVEQGFLRIARACGVEENSKAVKRWLSNLEDSWLLIIDNADDPSQDVSQYFPTGDRGSVIITTRNPGCEIHATVGSYDFGRMALEDAITLLLRAAGGEDASDEASRDVAKPIVEILGCLALAIIQAGAVIRRKLYSMKEYRTVYSRRRKQLLSDGPIQGANDYRYTVYTTWEVSIGVIENMSNKTADDAIELLQFFSMLHFDNIPEDILKNAWLNRALGCASEYMRTNQLSILRNQAADVEDDIENNAAVLDADDEEEEREKVVQEDDEQKQSSGTSGNWDPQLIRRATTLLSSFSLISISGSNDRISMHPLVHAWVRDRLSESEQKICWRIASSTLALSIPYNEWADDYTFPRLLLPHVRSCLDSKCSELFTTKELELDQTNAAESFAFVYSANGLYQEAKEITRRVSEIRVRILGVEHLYTLSSLQNHAGSCYNLGQYQDALKLYEKVVERRKHILGEEHIDTLQSIGNLASCCFALGRYRDASNLNEKVLKVSKRTQGEEHHITLRLMSNLAFDYRRLGRDQDALDLDKKVLEVRKRIHCEEHPDILVSMNNLALYYMNVGQKQEALELLKKAVEGYKRTLGEEHPETLVSMEYLAWNYGEIGRKQEALELYEKVVKVRKRTLGEEHPKTLSAMHNLAVMCGREQEAQELLERVVKVRHRMLGEEHPNTLNTMYDLACVYYYLGQEQEAQELLERVVEVRKRTLSEEHPKTLSAICDLVGVYYGLGREQEAQELLERVVEVRKRTLGEEHSNTLSAMHDLAVIYHGLGQEQEALELLKRVVEVRKRTLSEEHPDTLRAVESLAIVTTSLNLSRGTRKISSRLNFKNWIRRRDRL